MKGIPIKKNRVNKKKNKFFPKGRDSNCKFNPTEEKGSKKHRGVWKLYLRNHSKALAENTANSRWTVRQEKSTSGGRKKEKPWRAR